LCALASVFAPGTVICKLLALVGFNTVVAMMFCSPLI
jgi:hypothetical protein